MLSQAVLCTGEALQCQHNKLSFATYLLQGTSVPFISHFKSPEEVLVAGLAVRKLTSRGAWAVRFNPKLFQQQCAIDMPPEHRPEPRTPAQYKDVEHKEIFSEWLGSPHTDTQAKSISIK